MLQFGLKTENVLVGNLEVMIYRIFQILTPKKSHHHGDTSERSYKIPKTQEWSVS